MRRMTLMKKSLAAERSLDRILAALEAEIVQAGDDEIVEAARDLGMNLAMRGSAAFIGLKYPSGADLRAFFEPSFESARVAHRPVSLDGPPARPGADDKNGSDS
ncbi:MAG TPA: hypothetical protein VFL30_05070 [Rhodanobacteraceae bacterium]|nr:hypothetical protein [Rhodanobacteraceae bacterium]